MSKSVNHYPLNPDTSAFPLVCKLYKPKAQKGPFPSASFKNIIWKIKTNILTFKCTLVESQLLKCGGQMCTLLRRSEFIISEKLFAPFPIYPVDLKEFLKYLHLEHSWKSVFTETFFLVQHPRDCFNFSPTFTCSQSLALSGMSCYQLRVGVRRIWLPLLLFL